jgi:L-rhamnose mutarotase
MVYSVYEINLNSVAYAMNAWELSPAIDGNGNYIINYSIYYTSPMAITFQMFFYVDVVMYPREMVNVQPNKNWGNI